MSGYLIGNQAANETPLPPPAELSWWYQFYFATERGRIGYDKYRHDFAKLICRTASPKWNFDDETFDQGAAAFNNTDHVDIVIDNYRWRLGLSSGEPHYNDLEQQLAAGPVITVPTITLEGDANGAPHQNPNAYATRFSGTYTTGPSPVTSDATCRKKRLSGSSKPHRSRRVHIATDRCRERWTDGLLGRGLGLLGAQARQGHVAQPR